MSSALLRETAHAVLDHQELGQLCVALLDRCRQELTIGGFQAVATSQAGIDLKRFGAELVCYGRFQARDGSTPVTLCVRMTCKSSSTPPFLTAATIELHRQVVLGCPEHDADTFLTRLTLAYLPGPVDLDLERELDEFAQARTAALLKGVDDSLRALPAGVVLSIVEEVLAP